MRLNYGHYQSMNWKPKKYDLKEEYLRLRCGHVSRQLADVNLIKKARRNIARLNTVLTEKLAKQ